MLLFYVFLYALIGSLAGDRRLTQQENQFLQSICGTKPSPSIAPKENVNRLTESRSIHGGIEIDGKMAPWAVRVFVYEQSTGSATLISPRHILSANHLIYRNELMPYIKAAKQSCENEGKDLVIRENNGLVKLIASNGRILSENVSKIIFFEMCVVNNTSHDDVMLIELNNDVIFDDYTFPACIPKNNAFETINSTVYVTGFGLETWDNTGGSTKLRYGFLKIARFSEDRRFFDARDFNEKVVVRGGDSGGSAMVSNNSRFYVVGVIHAFWWPDNYLSSMGSVGFDYDKICHHSGIC